MRKENLKNFKGGWVVGAFKPSLLDRMEVEVGIKRYKKGEINSAHFHKEAIEFTIVIDGTISMNNVIFSKDDVIEIDKEEVSDFKALTDCCLCVIKSKSVLGDKYIIDPLIEDKEKHEYHK